MLRKCFSIFRTHFQSSYLFGANIKEQRIPFIKQDPQIPTFSLNHLWDNEGARHKSKRLGRGNASGKGNSCGKGQRGQKSRTSPDIGPKFEGGQTPIQRRLPKWGKIVKRRERIQTINLNQILYAIWQGRINPQLPITIKTMYDAGLFKRVKYGVKLLARGATDLSRLQSPINIEVSDASASAIRLIKEKGGQVTCVYRTPLLIQEHLKPEKFDLHLRQPIPPSYRVRRLDRIEARGAKVIYRKPQWKQSVQEQKEKDENNLSTSQVNSDKLSQVVPDTRKSTEIDTQEKQKKKKTDKPQKIAAIEDELKDFNYPVKREEGCGRTKIRRRKPSLFRLIQYKL